MSADLIIELNRLLDRCEREAEPELELLEDAFRSLFPKPEKVWAVDHVAWTPEYGAWQQHQAVYFERLEAGAFVDAAILLLPAGAIWRRYTDQSASVYAASPYNAAAQTRYDGRNVDSFACALVAAIIRLRLAPLLRADARKTQAA